MSKTPEALLTEIQGYIDEQRRKMEDGEPAELAGLNTLAEKLCHEVERMAATPERKQHAERITLLVEDLKRLEAELKERTGLLKGEISGLSRARQANKAYQTASGPAQKTKAKKTTEQ